MALEIMHDPRVRAVEWKDLVGYSRWEAFREVTICLPWLFLSWWMAALAVSTMAITPWGGLYYVAAAGFSFMFFLTGLRQVHNGYHYALGIPRGWTDFTIYLLSVLMSGSMHAVKYNHLQHHKHCMDDDDVEAMSARMPGWKALALGPYFPVMLHINAWKNGGPKYRRWIVAELAGNIIFITLVFTVFNVAFLKYHVIAMILGQCGTAFFAVWTVHHDCDREHYIARTQRTWWKNCISYNMFFHTEHHLYPTVPTCHLPELARRLDEAAPELAQKQVY